MESDAVTFVRVGCFCFDLYFPSVYLPKQTCKGRLTRFGIIERI